MSKALSHKLTIEPRPCTYCGRQFRPHMSQLRRGVGRFCSMSCAASGRVRPTLAERFWSKVDQSGGPNACWPYRGFCDKEGRGYGQVRVEGRAQKAHRIAYQLAIGPLAPCDYVLHKCDNPPCCNPDHLFVGTQRENMDDMSKKGRRVNPVGDENGRAKLTSERVRDIRRSYTGRRGQQKALARYYGVSVDAIQDIVARRTWKHVEE